MKEFLQKMLGLGFLGDWAEKLNGNKTYVGILSILLYVLNAIPTVFVDMGWSLTLADNLHKVLLWMGVVLVPVGLGHKVIK